MVKSTSSASLQSTKPNAADRCEVRLAESAAAAYERFQAEVAAAEELGEMASAAHAAMALVDQALQAISLDAEANKKHALVGKLKNIYRATNGNIRVCWLISSGNQIFVISIMESTDIEASNPNKQLSKAVAAGDFNQLFSSLGMKACPSVYSEIIQ